MTDVLLAARDVELYADLLAHDGCRWLTVADDGSVQRDGVAVAVDDLRADVAWFSLSVYYGSLRQRFFDLVESTTSLRWVHSSAAGYDLPIFRVLIDRGTRLTTAHVNAIPIAEFTLRSVLDHYQQPQLWRDAQSDTRWAPREFREIDHTTWTIIGFGHIGSAVARLARAFGATVIGVRRSAVASPHADEMMTPDDLPAALARAQVVVLALPYTPDSEKMVDAGFLRHMRPESVLVNVARGAIVDEEALIDALDRRQIEHAILDAFVTEPLPADSPLWRHPHIDVTPHNAAGGLARHRRGAELFAENLRLFEAGRALLHEV
jgi:phosphoglycerate dehydrogenase-like enzyme